MKGWKRKVAICSGIALALYAILGFLVVPPIVRSQLESRLTALLGRQVAVEAVRFNPFTLSAAVRGFSLKEADGAANAVAFEELRDDVTWSSLLRGGVVVEALELAKPQVRVVRGTDGKYSFQDIV